MGPSNRFAYNAALAVTDKPAEAYNPLFIYGPSGLGKTHLLYAIANRIQKNYLDFNIIYINSDLGVLCSQPALSSCGSQNDLTKTMRGDGVDRG